MQKVSEAWFAPFRENIIGFQSTFESPWGRKKILYADWTASGRAYRPIEEYLQEEVLPYFANTHTATTFTGRKMSQAYEEAKEIIKHHVCATPEDVLLFCGSGMTAAVCKLQRILAHEVARAVVFITHMEHHSNQINWLERAAKVVIIRSAPDGNVDLAHLRELLVQYRDWPYKIAAVTACSNVTGIETPYQEIAVLLHAAGGLCFVDFACSAPYVRIDMRALDAIYFSGHKFLGGPGTPGILIFKKELYENPFPDQPGRVDRIPDQPGRVDRIPDQPGGGTLLYSNPWAEFEYLDDIETREDGGTPPILQGIKLAQCVLLKEEMGVDAMLHRERELVLHLLDRLKSIPRVEVLEPTHRKRLGIVSFVMKDAHYDEVVEMLNDRFGIQTRGGCSCAGTYGHKLLGIDKTRSHEIWQALRAGETWAKPGWVRISLHPTMTHAEIDFISDAVEQIAESVTSSNPRLWCA